MIINNMNQTALIIDDEESICWGLSQLCAQLGIASQTASSVESAMQMFDQDPELAHPDVMILDVRLPGQDGISAVAKFHQRFGKIPIVIVTAFGDLQTAISAVQAGAFEYIVKPFDLQNVRQTLKQALNAPLIIKEAAVVAQSPTGLVGQSPAMQQVFKQIALTTTNDTPVLLAGESGTGKELTARAIHRFGRRSDRPFVPVNIAALNPALAESELFGHVAGAYTGATTQRMGLIQQAEGGTLFLDEVADIPLEVQVKLLRVLDSGEVTPVGSNQSVQVDFRLICATHQDLGAKVVANQFRHDLYYRICSFEIPLPPLRERVDDLGPLVTTFLSRLRPDHSLVYSADFLDELKRRRWPGNVRQLKMAIEHAAVVARGSQLTAADLPDDPDAAATDATAKLAKRLEQLSDGQTESLMADLVRQWTLSQWEKDDLRPLHERLLAIIEPPLLQAAFEKSGQQYQAAARRLGLHRTTVKKKLENA